MPETPPAPAGDPPNPPAPPAPPPPPAPTAPPAPTGGGGDEPLRDEGKRALEAERAARAAAEREAKAAQTELETLRKRTQTEEEKAIEAARAEGRSEVEAKANARIVRAEVAAVAGGKLADPTDAPLHLDLAQFEVAEDGSVDRKAMAAAIDALVKEKPYLAAKPTHPGGNAGGGPQGGGDGNGQTVDDWIRQQARH